VAARRADLSVDEKINRQGAKDAKEDGFWVEEKRV